MKLSIIKIPSQDVSKLLHLYSDDDNDTFIKNRQTQITTGTIEIYAIKDHEEIIGEVTLVYNDPHKYFTLPQERVYMEALRILPEYQGRGIGQFFVKEIMNKVKIAGYKEITIGVEEDNLIAKHIYSKLGFNNFLQHEKGDKYAPNGYDVFFKIL